MTSSRLGLYLHVPFCKALCHYCDFAKTANFRPEFAQAYLDRLGTHLDAWLEAAVLPSGPFTSIYFGGGTPSLFAEELAPLFERLQGHVAPGAEITLEANPDDVTAERCRTWRRLGINRLSLGAQTFDPAGLAFLKRVHGAGEAERAAAMALEHFASVNLDLIYGWKGQDAALWQKDLERARATGVQHLSLYDLTFEGRTPLARAVARGKLLPSPDEDLESRYETARAFLAVHGFEQEEVSNWHLPGHEAQHNWLYWRGDAYVGIGAGAHGFLPQWGDFGTRWAYDKNERKFLAPETPESLTRSTDSDVYARALGLEPERGRDADDLASELVGIGLRCRDGVDLALLEQRTGKSLGRLRPTISDGLERGLLHRTSERLRLEPAEWFRENAWSVEVLLSLS